MAPLAQLAALWGARVTGSDRNWDRGVPLPIFDGLRSAGVAIVPQDGTGILPDLDALVHSSAVEPTNPDVVRADALGVPRIRRGSFLAELVASRRTVAIAGTSGKSTITAMVAHILSSAGFDPSYLGGGAAVDLAGAVPPGSLRVGASDWFVIETDESDGSVAEFAPAIATLTNLTRDHKEIDVVAGFFGRLLSQTREHAVIHVGDPALAMVTRPAALSCVTVAVEGEPTWEPPQILACDIRYEPASVRFRIERAEVRVLFPGALTVQNAVLSIATAFAAGVPVERSAQALESFAGVRRRLERIGAAGGIDVFDDFAHNPVKIRFAVQALRPKGSLWVYYQPHGYGPTRFFRDQLVETFAEVIRPEDHLLLAPIYDAGGTADRSIRSEDLAEEIARHGVPAKTAPTRQIAEREIREGARPGDRVVVMGARDDTLPTFARSLLAAIAASSKEPASP